MKSKKKSSVNVTCPQLPPPDQLSVLDSLDLVSDADYAYFQLSSVDLKQSHSQDSIIESARFCQVTLGGASFETCRLTDILFDGCDASNAIWTDCKLTRLEFSNCKFTGFKMIDAQVSSVSFNKCVGQLVQMCGSVFKKVVFNECNFSGADFSNCTFEETVFSKCDLREAIFYNGTLTGTDFRTSELLGLKVFAPDLFGITIERRQALELAEQLAALLGMELTDD